MREIGRKCDEPTSRRADEPTSRSCWKGESREKLAWRQQGAQSEIAKIMQHGALAQVGWLKKFGCIMARADGWKGMSGRDTTQCSISRLRLIPACLGHKGSALQTATRRETRR